jgi:calcineurin-like phosphoesterase family protein
VGGRGAIRRFDMNIIYTLEDLENNNFDSIFLAGPTHRIEDDKKPPKSWRKDIIEKLEKGGFEGNILCPEWRDDKKPKGWSYTKQVDWEKKYLKRSNAIVFWIPRDMKVLPALTTNIEFGEYLNSGKIFVGAPKEAEKNKYLQERCEKLNIKWHYSLKDMVSGICEKFNKETSDIYFTSDTHFGSERTLSFSKRPFLDVDIMDNNLISEWNSSVTNKDIVFHLGDFGNPEIVKYLSGSIIYIISGNHDSEQVKKDLLKDTRVKVIDNYVMKLRDKKIGLVHEPLQKLDDVDFYLFGHVHSLSKIKRNGLNVGVDCHHFKPIGLETVEFYMNAVENFYDENVFCEEI